MPTTLGGPACRTSVWYWGSRDGGTRRGWWLLLSSAPHSMVYPVLSWLTAPQGFLQTHLNHPLQWWVLKAG